MVMYVKASFNVLTQPWIPVLERNGTTKEAGLMEVLEQAHIFCGINDSSPMVEYSVYRFLIVFLMDMLRLEDEEALDELLEEGRFDPDIIHDYVDQCQKEGVSFDLFDSEHPFLQTSYRKDWDREPKPVSTLDYSIPNGNNHIHFEHKREKVVYTPGKALRMMLAAQIFCTAGAQGYPSNVNGAPPWFTLIRGKNLFQTLVFGMIGTDRIDLPLDHPPVLWRNFEEVMSKEKIAKTSWLFGTLFPARRIRLIPDEAGESVSNVYFSQGMNYEVTDAWTDPHVTYRYNKKGRFNWKPSGDETIWRNLTDIIDTNSKHATQIVEQYKELDHSDESLSLVIYGVQTNQASYMKAQRHDLQIPKQLLGNETALRFIRSYMDQSEHLAQALYKTLAQEEIPEESRIQAKQRYYAICEQSLWAMFEALIRPEFDYEANRIMTAEQQCSAAADCVDWTLRQLTLRGKAMLQVMNQRQKILGKEIATIKKGMST